MISHASRYWAVIPAAGIGKRLGADRPKQYLALGRKPILTRTIDRLRAHPSVAGVVVVISPDDRYWPTLTLAPASSRLMVTMGGAERCHSVLNGLLFLRDVARADDWVLVHDAARPLLRRRDVDVLVEQLQSHPVGGLLGVPVSDTIKRAASDGEIHETVDRSQLWRAFTPQMFRLAMLTNALQQALDSGHLVTDEAQAMEHAGHRPKMVEGHGDNIKITRTEDLALAEYYLSQQPEEL